jgi:hypothetical protein
MSLVSVPEFMKSLARSRWFLANIRSRKKPYCRMYSAFCRKFFTVLASVIFFGNSLAGRQWVGVVLVFAGLFLDGAFGKRKVN